MSDEEPSIEQIDALTKALNLQRQCGDCSLCCKLLNVPEVGKPANDWCPHCRPGHREAACTGCTTWRCRCIGFRSWADRCRSGSRAFRGRSLRRPQTQCLTCGATDWIGSLFSRATRGYQKCGQGYQKCGQPVALRLVWGWFCFLQGYP